MKLYYKAAEIFNVTNSVSSWLKVKLINYSIYYEFFIIGFPSILMNPSSKRLFRRSVSLSCSSSLIWISLSISFNLSISSFCLSIRSSSFFSLLSTFISSFLSCLFFLLLLIFWWNLPCLSIYISRWFTW